jgi:general L-amino acid transport system permease protein
MTMTAALVVGAKGVRQASDWWLVQWTGEGAAAMGLGYWRAMGLVILPQALKLVIPGIVNTFIALFKDTSLVIIIGLFDLLNSVKQAAADPAWLGMATEGYVFAALVFWIFCFGMSRYSMHLERKLDTGHKR